MELRTFPLEVNAMPQTVVLKIEKELNISQTDQLLLMEGGVLPIATKRILEQMKENNPTVRNRSFHVTHDRLTMKRKIDKVFLALRAFAVNVKL